MLTPNTDNADRSEAAGRPTGNAACSKVLDLEGLLNRCMGNIGLVQRVLQKFEERMPEEFKDMESALESGDIDRVASLAHRVKGSSASVSAEGMMHAAAEIETAGRSGCETDLSERMVRLRDEWKRYLEYVPTVLAPVGKA